MTEATRESELLRRAVSAIPTPLIRQGVLVFPVLIDLYRQGRFDLDAFVSETIGLDDVEAAFAKMHAGEVLRSVVVL